MSDSDHHERGEGDGLEELGDDVIIAQETAAHAPAPRARVTTDHPTVVISEPPGRRHPSTLPPARRSERGEKTVVIRDRRKLESLRRSVSKRPRRRFRFLPEARTLYLLAAAVALSLVAGTVLALLLEPDPVTEDAAPVIRERRPPPPPEPEVEEDEHEAEVIELDDLPLEKKKR